MYKKVVIVTPAYKKHISKDELLSIESVQKYLNDYQRVIAAPKKYLDDKEFNKIWQKFGYQIIYFDDRYFKGVDTYNKFMFSVDFYKEFIDYEYILICQLDVLIFSDTLDYWLSKKFDYIGAPMILEGKFGLQFYYGCNGGLSLRRVKSFLNVLESKQFYRKDETFNMIPIKIKIKYLILIKLFLKYKFLERFNPLFRYLYRGNEDSFWSFYADFFVKDFRVANIEESLAFAFERYPAFCYEKNNFKLPFGVHAWQKYDPDFWKDKVLYYK